MPSPHAPQRTFTLFLVLIALGVALIILKYQHTSVASTASVIPAIEPISDAPTDTPAPVPLPPAHITAPAEVHGVYLTGWSAGTRKAVDRVLGMAEEARINTVVIDIKDATGRLSYQPIDQNLAALRVGTNRIPDLPALLAVLHEKNIYVIGRVAVFQDPFFATVFPAETFSDLKNGGVWRDRKGIAWLRPDSQKVWDHVVAISQDAYAQGFDEINLDYVRYPSDGDLSRFDRPNETVREQTIESFFQYLDQKLRQEDHIPLSADVFGLTTSALDDIGIGQKFERIVPHVDYICPMVYPSHYAVGTFGIAEPAAKPYEIIHHALADAETKLAAVNEPIGKLRPWFQDFTLVGVIYTPTLIDAQITAGEELGVNSWLFWDPRNIYTSFQSAMKNVSLAP